MQNIFVDFEMTSGNKINSSEIIEIGAVKLNERFEIIDTYKSYIKPNSLNNITKKITRITGINQDMVGCEREFREVVQEFIKWIGNQDTVLYQWGPDDKKQLVSEYERKIGNIIPIQFNNWVDTQLEFMQIFDMRNQISLEQAMNMLSEEFKGKQHDALDDAINSAVILKILRTKEKLEQKKKVINNLHNTQLSCTIGDLLKYKLQGKY